MTGMASARLLFFVLLPLSILLANSPASGQSSVGFADPDDLASLLAYRLPTWSYRTWTANGDLSGSGADVENAEVKTVRNSLATSLASRLRWNRMAESEDRSLSAALDADYNQQHVGDELGEFSGHSLQGGVAVSGSIRRYLQPGGFWFQLEADGDRGYAESMSTLAPASSREIYRRSTNYAAGGSVGRGRVRDVTPLIRAQRLSERLSALGRPRLRAAQVRRIAEVLATQQGYRAVFDRPDRHFWRDALEPMLEDRAPLTPYEILYLMEVLQEDVGGRYEGSATGLSARYAGRRGNSAAEDFVYDSRELGVFGEWSHNLSLHHQVRANLTVGYLWAASWGRKDETAQALLRLRHLWCMADRYNLDTTFSLSGSYDEEDGSVVYRSLSSAVDSQFRVYLEDALALVTGVNAGNIQRSGEIPRERDHGWQWSYHVGLEYSLDRVLY